MKHTILSDYPRKLNLLWDGDYLCYRTGFAADAQAARDMFGDDYKKLDKAAVKEALASIDYLTYALANTKTVLQAVGTEVFTPDYVKVYLTGEDNFRDQLATLRPYKGTRDPNFKPKYYKEIREYLVKQWDAEVINGMEADDALGIEQFKHKDKSTCIVAVDKDLWTVPGYHYSWVKREVSYVTIEQANTFFLMQMLEGDSSDNVPGITGVGPKTTQKIVERCGGDQHILLQNVIAYYKTQYRSDWIGAFNEIAALLWILREEGKPCPYLVTG